MSREGLQMLIKKIFGDPEFRREFLSDAKKVVSKFDLTSEERAAVLSYLIALVVSATPIVDSLASGEPTGFWLP